VTKSIFATNIHGSDGCWSRFLNTGNFSEANLSVPGGGMTGETVDPVVYQGGKDYRITSLKQVFDISGNANFQLMLKALFPVLRMRLDHDKEYP